MSKPISRRDFNRLLSRISVGAYAATSTAPAFGQLISDDKSRPNITSGVACGDVVSTAATVWSRSDRPSRMIVEWARDESFKNSKRILGAETFEHQDFTAKLRLTGLSPGEQLFYRVSFQDLDDSKKVSAPVSGIFRTPSLTPRDIRFAWSGDTAGQGFGIDLARGGMKTFETIRRLAPDFFVNSGDVCYADNPISNEISLDNGDSWKNVVLEEKAKVAETLDEFRANYRYNLLDENVRRFNSEIPMFVQWDDHETLNNWYPGEILTDDRYRIKSVSQLAARAKQAFFDYLPIHPSPDGTSKIYRSIPYGPLLELFFLDLRSFRGPNSQNRQSQRGPETAYLGSEQLQWLKRKLKASQATWKVICSDMPIGLIVSDGKDYENNANGDGPALGRELEIAELLRFMKANQIKNTVWLTADVHYAASHYYDPNQAVFQDFDPFWEFVSGPLHAGTFGPGAFDNTFGPQLKFKGIPDGMKPNRPPSEGYQFFGLVQIDSLSSVMTVKHYDVSGKELWSIDLMPSQV